MTLIWNRSEAATNIRSCKQTVFARHLQLATSKTKDKSKTISTTFTNDIRKIASGIITEIVNRTTEPLRKRVVIFSKNIMTKEKDNNKIYSIHKPST
ncbi:MAG: hypothetical protein LBQ28_09990 [Prevotellaceae bacterium]|jgi:hypothetical protein|nr:hypothetical protein [Prevotellaceae bacterium]